MTITITAFERSPDGGKGLARDTRVRWALEEVGQPYKVRLVSFRAMKEPAHLALHPFGQIPTYEEGGLALFETGAIVFHIAERYPGLLPDDDKARARAITWMFAALSTVEPPILELQSAVILESKKPWNAERLPLVKDRVREEVIKQKARDLSKQKAAEIAAKLKNAPDFEKAAKAAGTEAKTTELLAQDAPIPDLGAAPAVQDAAFKLPVNAVSEPIATDNGTAVIKVLEKKSVTPEEWTSSKDRFREELLADRRNRFFSAYMVKAKAKMKIEVNRESLLRAAS